MDFFQHPYYRLTKTFMTLGGYWPYQSTSARCGRTAVLICIYISQIVPSILALLKYRDEREIVESISAFIFEALCATKGFGCLWNLPKIMELLNRIRTDWQMLAQDREINILHEYAEQGRKMSLVFTVMMYSVAVVYVLQPSMPKIIDVLLKNGTAPGEFPFPVDYYYLDMQKYYFFIIVYTYVCICAALIGFVASEITLIITVQHVCGVFAALGCKLQRIVNNNTSVQSEGTLYGLEKRDMADLASCIDKHNGAIDYANLIELTYTWIILCMVGLGMVMANLYGLQICLGQNNPEVTAKCVAVVLGTIVYLYVECYISQLLMDHSISIHLYIYDSQWYKLTRKAQKRLQLMIMRCSVPCTLTAGNFFILSMRTFAQVTRTTISYFTVVRSMQI